MHIGIYEYLTSSQSLHCKNESIVIVISGMFFYADFTVFNTETEDFSNVRRHEDMNGCEGLAVRLALVLLVVANQGGNRRYYSARV